MKKLVALGMALTMVMSILTGCGGSASSARPAPELPRLTLLPAAAPARISTFLPVRR